MSNFNKTYRINTKVGEENNDINLNLNILQDYDILEILSLKISTENFYKLHTSNYGCVIGRVLANGGVGIPNAKISIFISADSVTSEDEILNELYPYKTFNSTNSSDIRYNLLPIEQINECHQPIGTLPNKRLVLDDKHVLEIFDKYYKFTTVTNESGDYMLFGVPHGNQILHMDMDLSDIGFLSQKPIDMFYKGFTKTSFDNNAQFKTDTNLDNLVQVFSQNDSVYVKPFWGESSLEEVGITRNDIKVNYKFEPTCIFMGSMVSDEKGKGFTKRCVPMPEMGRMDKLVTGNGRIEMIRKRIDGSVEDFPIMGNELIDGNGIWCYQIPMNLDYVTTDEYGNLVSTDNPEKGIPTRTRVRFRISLNDYESDSTNDHLVKVLIPNNPTEKNKIDYVFGTYTEDEKDGSKSFRDLFWNNVYTVKSYIPRIQRGKHSVRTKKFTGVKTVNVNNGNNPMPYNNMRVNITFKFIALCNIIKALVFIIKAYNWFIGVLPGGVKNSNTWRGNRKCAYIGDGLCPDLEGWYFAPGCGERHKNDKDTDWKKGQREATLKEITDSSGGNGGVIDSESNDADNSEKSGVCLTTNTSYFMECVELNLALENEVIQFDFYNDWINGLVYIPRWFVNLRKKRKYFFTFGRTIEPKPVACTDTTYKFERYYTQQCSIGYKPDNNGLYVINGTPNGCVKNSKNQRCHTKNGRKLIPVFGKRGGIVHEEKTLQKHNVYYLKPCEWIGDKKCNFFATDIVLLGNINKCNIFGIPNDFDGLTSSTFQMPPSIAVTNMDSDGVLYGIKNGGGKSICSGNEIKDGVEKVEQTFESENEWMKSQGLFDNTIEDDTNEYAVTEISGIDWGYSGPNQGEEDFDKLYFPGGHFLSIACSKSHVNIKSCVNLSRICEIGVTMSQRKSNVSEIIKNEDGTFKELRYDHIIPTGFISKDEIDDNNFRNIFATLNYNRLKTRLNENGMREYDFIPIQPINFNGALENKVGNNEYNQFKYDNNNDKNALVNATAYTRTLETNSKDYYYFRFGVDENCKNYDKTFLLTENGLKYLPMYENSYYFYFGLKQGNTALDKFITDYYATCPKQSEPLTPDFMIEINEPILCNENSGSLIIKTVNVPVPYKVSVYKNSTLVYNEEEYTTSITLNESIEKGEYNIVITNENKGISLSKTVNVEEKMPNNNEYNFYDGSCSLSHTDYIEEPLLYYDNTTKKIEVIPNDNGGVITITIPKMNTNKKPPYIYGFAIIGQEYGVCKVLSDQSNGGEKIINALKNDFGNITYLNYNTTKKVSKYSDLEKVDNNSFNMFEHDDNETLSFSLKGWGDYIKHSLYICYTCDGNKLNVTKYDECIPLTLSESFSYYLFDETVKLNNINKSVKNEVITITKNERGNVGVINYENIHELSDYEEWAFKRALYFNGSYFNNDEGKIICDIVGGTPPYEKIIYGDFENVDDEGGIVIESNVYNYDNEDLNIDSFKVPTKAWNGGFETKNSYELYFKDSKKSIPQIYTSVNNIC